MHRYIHTKHITHVSLRLSCGGCSKNMRNFVQLTRYCRRSMMV